MDDENFLEQIGGEIEEAAQRTYDERERLRRLALQVAHNPESLTPDSARYALELIARTGADKHLTPKIINLLKNIATRGDANHPGEDPEQLSRQAAFVQQLVTCCLCRKKDSKMLARACLGCICRWRNTDPGQRGPLDVICGACMNNRERAFNHMEITLKREGRCDRDITDTLHEKFKCSECSGLLRGKADIFVCPEFQQYVLDYARLIRCPGCTGMCNVRELGPHITTCYACTPTAGPEIASFINKGLSITEKFNTAYNKEVGRFETELFSIQQREKQLANEQARDNILRSSETGWRAYTYHGAPEETKQRVEARRSTRRLRGHRTRCENPPSDFCFQATQPAAAAPSSKEAAPSRLEPISYQMLLEYHDN